jgi:RNA polymerase sigma-70 factor, ECF subfamily
MVVRLGTCRLHSTPASLLERVCRQGDPEAWGRFVKLYTPLIFYWARRCGLQQEDAADLTQDVFANLVEKLPEFTYDRRQNFRSWLRTVTLNLWRDRAKRVATRPLPGDADRLEELPAPDQIPAQEEAEYRQQIVSRALALLKGDFQAATWQAFWEHGVLGRPADDVARDMQMSLAAVYGARFRVLNRLRQELDGLLE